VFEEQKMGTIWHNAIVITSSETNELAAVWNKAVELFGPLASPVIKSSCNGYFSFFIAPDGSKEGWPESDDMNQRRAALCKFISACTHIKYVDVGFGETFFGNKARIERTNMLTPEMDDE
jgi:hypothetical protein